MNDWLFEVIRCPLSREPLSRADQETVSRLTALQASQQLFSHKGLPVTETFQSGLVNQSHTWFFRITDNIPALLPDEAVSLAATQ